MLISRHPIRRLQHMTAPRVHALHRVAAPVVWLRLSNPLGPHSRRLRPTVYLQIWLLDHYQSSTFNTCEHQSLPIMDGPPSGSWWTPMQRPLPTTPPFPVPFHWRDDIKAGLERDVRLGVLEPVPIGEPVTWCHRMVVVAKKTGKLRRTVDYQPLNKHATRETHHTQSRSTWPGPGPTAQRRPSSTLGMDIIASHFTPMTNTLQRS